MKLSLSKKKISTTMLISMTDVIFLLIIFLLIASNFASQTGLPIRLPGSVSADRQTLETINITYFQDGTLYYNGKSISMEQLSSSLQSDFQDEQQVVRLSAEDDMALQRVIAVMDIIRQSGFERIFVATQQVQP